MKKYLIAVAIGIAMTAVSGVLAGMGGGACHCNTPLRILFPYMSMLGERADPGILGTLLFVLQWPIYAVSVVLPRRSAWQMGVLVIILMVHASAVALAS